MEGQLAVKGFRIAGVTKSCHQCQYQHVYRQCKCVRPDCECRGKHTKGSSKGSKADNSALSSDGEEPRKQTTQRKAVVKKPSKAQDARKEVMPPLEPECLVSVCQHCIERHYAGTGYTYDDATVCPRCLNMCNCRYHLRVEHHSTLPHQPGYHVTLDGLLKKHFSVLNKARMCPSFQYDDVMMYLFTTVPHPHGHWQLQELLGNI